MVERLKAAMEKARALRADAVLNSGLRGGSVDGIRAAREGGTRRPPGAAGLDAAWNRLEPIELNASHLERSRVITHARTDPAHVAFDVLRTRLLRVFSKHGWSRLGITSPGKGCGKTFTAANLALSLSRQADCRTILMDMDLRSPGLAKVLGVSDSDPIRWFLSGDVSAEEYLVRIGANLAIGLNSQKAVDAGETLFASSTADALGRMLRTFAPHAVVYDLPPILACDDVLGFLPQLDCVLLVAGAGKTSAAEISECERLLRDQTHLLGVLLNRAEDASLSHYGYVGG